MFIKIPFESTIEFKTNISEITKMSLEHDFNVNDGVVLGNFYISGEYKVYEVSINKESFNYTLPFTVELRDDIKSDTLEFNIEDFSYDVIDNKNLKVNIEYSLKAEIEEELFERVDENELESELSFIDNFLVEDSKDEVAEVECVEEVELPELKGKNEERELPEVKEVLKEEIKLERVIPDAKEVLKDEVKVEEPSEEVRISKEEEKTIMDTIKDSDDSFVTYHIHIVKEAETLESICHMYNVPASLITEYNNFDSLSIGDKVLIPKLDE